MTRFFFSSQSSSSTTPVCRMEDSSVEKSFIKIDCPCIPQTCHPRIPYRILNSPSDFYEGWCLLKILAVCSQCLEIGHNI